MNMKIAVASGKGGTGKTTIAVALAMSADEPVWYLDCDVEEPNGHIFIKPDIKNSNEVFQLIPVLDESKCTLCGKCAEFCQFNAIVAFGTKPLFFSELCHSCGGCMLICPANAIYEVNKPIGIVEVGKGKNINFVHAKLNVGEPMSPPLIRAVKKYAEKKDFVIIDSPPGTSCPVITAINGSDFLVLVTEPTPFGLNDLKLAVETVRELKIPFGVIINKSDSGDNRVIEYCDMEDIIILAEVPESMKIAEAYSRGEVMLDVIPEYVEIFRHIIKKIKKLNERNCNY
jgi:MinD superfamily P-loop ATPase